MWLVLEYCVGGNLRTLLQYDIKLTEDSVHNFGRDLARGLHYLHSKGIIHCDLKPPNLFLNEDGRIKLAGFGMSRSLEEINNEEASAVVQS